MKKWPLLLIASALTLSCGKSSHKSDDLQSNKTNALKSISLATGISNAEFSKIILRTLTAEQKEVIDQEVKKLTAEEIKTILEQTSNAQYELGLKYYYPENQITYHHELFKSLITHPGHHPTITITHEKQLQYQALIYIQDKTLGSIVTTFENRSQQLISDISGDLITELTRDRALGHQILQAKNAGDKQSFVRKISDNKKFIEAVDHYFKNSHLNRSEQDIVLLASLSAAAVYPFVKNSQTLHQLIESAKKMKEGIVDFNNKKKEIQALSRTLEEHFNKTESSFKKLKSGLEQTKIQAFRAKITAKDYNDKPEFKHFIKEIENQITGKKREKGDNPSVLSTPITINQGMTQSLEAIGEIADGLGNIVRTANNMSQMLGVKLSDDTMRIIGVAQKISNTVNLANTVISGLAGGGVLGALSAFNAIGASHGLLGGTNSMDGVINAKLDAILENQKEIMKMQIETMQMVKELAVMVDNYHAQEMYALGSLEIVNSIQSKMMANLLNSNVAFCDMIISEHVAYFGRKILSIDTTGQLKSGVVLADYPLIKDSLKAIKNFKDIKTLIMSDRSSWEQCLTSFDQVFSSTLYQENPILKFYETINIAHFKRYEDHTYTQILKSYRDLFNTQRDDNTHYHYFNHAIASKDYQGALLKTDFIRGFKSNQWEEALNLNNLISTQYLERYVTHLLWAIPFFKIKASDISLEQAKIRQEQNGNHRELKLLRQALFLTRSAIAQNIIQVGEPLLEIVDKNENFKPLFATDGCKDRINNLCFFRSNKILMQNFLHFYLYRKLSSPEVQQLYEDARLSKNTTFLEQVFGNRKVEFNKSRDALIIKLDLPEIKSIHELPLPPVSEILTAEVIYPHELNTLIEMQHALIEEITKLENEELSPSYLWLTL